MIVNVEITNFLKPFTESYKALSDEWHHLFSIGLEENLEAQAKKYYYVNTFLHRYEKVKFFDIFYPINITHKNKEHSFQSPKRLFRKFPFITIIGSAGSGKSTLTKALFLSSIKDRYKIPILIELRTLNEYSDDIKNFIFSKILNCGFEPSLKITDKALRKGHFIFILDGYDEIFLDNKQKFIAQIGNFIDLYPKNKYVITSRPGSGIEGLDRFHAFDVASLSEDDVVAFVDRMVDNDERKKRILTTVREQSANYSQYLKNPLLLSMFILAFESHPEIPTKKSAFYKNVFDTLYSKHDGVTKNSYLREKKTKLQKEDFEKILSLFCYLSLLDLKIQFTSEYFEEIISRIKSTYHYTFEVNDLLYDFETSISIFVKDGFEYKFPHRTMQEYYAASFLSALPTEKKQMAYMSFFNVIITAGTDNGATIFSLCEELDKANFFKFYIVEKLKTFLESLNGLKGIDLIVRFFHKAGTAVLIDRSEPADNRVVGISTFDFAKDPVLCFCGIESFENLLSNEQNESLMKSCNIFFSSESEAFPDDITKYALKNVNHSMKNIFDKKEFIDIINILINSIREKIEMLENVIDVEKNQIDAILGFLKTR